MEEDPYVISNLYILENAHSDPAITIKDVTSHFVITGCYIIGGQYNIYIDSIENGIATITNNSCLLGEYAGIHIVNTARHNISNNTIAYASGPGIYAWACDEMNIINNTCAFNSEGISLTYSNRFKIESNRCLNNGYIGIDLHTYSLFDGPVIGTICRNICIGNYIGIAISNDDGQMLNVSENIVIKNSNTGIRAFSVNASIFNNTIQYNRVGIFSRRLENCDIYNNLIQYNTDFGIEIEVTSYVLENIRIYHNYFDGNGDSNHSQVFCDSGILETQWFDETISEGNIWTDWNGTGSYYFETSEDVTNDTYDPYPLLANDTD
ncbi:MAG: hypothetical protein GOP50_09970, partial [Candidatus Heimdallarchaeota archaeon]|nr:hypothetical protein [Candidatus Heimdallarchaeota archaeon]